MAYKKSSETKKTIIYSAIKLFEEKGYYETNIKDIAREANIVHSSIYYYYKNKEYIAREIFDLIIQEIYIVLNNLYKENPNILLNIIVQYILTFEYLALNKSTQALHLDLVRFSDYDAENLERLRNSYFKNIRLLFEEYKSTYTRKQFNTYIITSDAFSKALIKGIINNHIDFSIEESIDYFCRRMIINDIDISVEEYLKTLEEAVNFCKNIDINIKDLI
jgi:AcrR family transcriptional regulator